MGMASAAAAQTLRPDHPLGLRPTGSNRWVDGWFPNPDDGKAHNVTAHLKSDEVFRCSARRSPWPGVGGMVLTAGPNRPQANLPILPQPIPPPDGDQASGQVVTRADTGRWSGKVAALHW